MEVDRVDDDLKAANARVGQTLGGKWRLDKLLGLGGMAAVYSATHKNNLSNVAVKVLHAELQRNEAIRTRFLREGYVANKVGHPGAVSAIDDGVDESGAVYLVMELLSGQSLAQRVDKNGGKLPPREVLEIAVGILDVLAAAHQQSVVHRDLKPDNIFIVADGGVKVLDFGVARVLDTTEAKTRTGLVMGTPEYMPPEQARGRSEHIDGRSDLWAVGAMMFRLIAGRYVHEAETQNEVLLLAMTDHSKPFAEVVPTIHPKVAALIDHALAYEPSDRFKDAEAMRDAVKDALAALAAQDSKSTLAGTSSAEDDDIDDAAATIPVTDFVKKTAIATPQARSGGSPDDSSPKKSLWVHTKATPAALPKAPQKKKRLLPIVLASGALALLCVGIAYGVPLLKGDPRSAGTASASSSSTNANMLADDPDADTDGGDDEIELDDDDAAVATQPTATSRPATNPSATSHPTVVKKKKKKKHH